MSRSPKTTTDVQRWFFQQIAGLWPAGFGCLSLRRSPCVRTHCYACETGEQHPSYVLYGTKKNGGKFALYIPDELAGRVEQSLKNGKALQKLMYEAAFRYANALKYERNCKKRK